jgi:GMP reductase
MSSEYFMLSTGITDRDLEALGNNIKKFENNGIIVKFICIDVANGYMFKLVDFCKRVRELYPNKTIVAGNVVSREITEELIINGKVDIVKVGIGSGAVCTTRIQTGVGMPQLSAIMECADAAHGLDGNIISDGGACYPGDVAKGFGGGADFVMLGSMFAGHQECPGEMIEENGKKYKLFYGMSSDTAMKKYHGGVANYRSSEGKTVKIPHKGPVQDTIKQIIVKSIICLLIE